MQQRSPRKRSVSTIRVVGDNEMVEELPEKLSSRKKDEYELLDEISCNQDMIQRMSEILPTTHIYGNHVRRPPSHVVVWYEVREKFEMGE